MLPPSLWDPGSADQIAVFFLDHFAKMDADAEFDTSVLWRTSVALGHAVLDFDRAAHGVYDVMDSMMLPSPVRLTMRPWWTATVDLIRSLRGVLGRARILSSSAPASRE